jgi:hypothetical protein
VIADGRTVIQPSNYAFLLYARRALLDAEPTVVAGLAREYAEAVRDAIADPAAAVRTLHGKIPDVEPIDLDRGLRRDAPNWTWDLAVDGELLEAVPAELREQGVILPGFDPASTLAPGVLRGGAGSAMATRPWQPEVISAERFLRRTCQPWTSTRARD